MVTKNKFSTFMPWTMTQSLKREKIRSISDDLDEIPLRIAE